VRAKQRLRLYLPGIAPSTKKPPLPPILHEDDRVIVLDKPAGLPVHPAGTDYTFAVIGLCRDHWPRHQIELVHRLDKDTSGVLVLAKDAQANRQLKAAFARGQATKEYFALVRGHPPWESAVFTGRIGPANGVIRIQMAVTDDGQDAHTEAFVLARHPDAPMSQVRCRIHTGRTHQIRVHLAHAGFGLVGDRMYGVPPEVFLRAWEHGVDSEVIRAAGAPRQALHALRVTLPHPNGNSLTVEAPIPSDLSRWWENPSVLPFDAEPAAEPVPDENRTTV
jgi:23S rRNA pseudouridine1911/1915/1917 synthase